MWAEICAVLVIALLCYWGWATSLVEAEQKRAEQAARERTDAKWEVDRANSIAAMHRNLDGMAHFMAAGYGATAGKATPHPSSLVPIPEEITAPVFFNGQQRAVKTSGTDLLIGMRLVLTDDLAGPDAVALSQLPWSKIRVRPVNKGRVFARCCVAHNASKNAAVLRLDEQCVIRRIEQLVNCDQDGENYGSWVPPPNTRS